jgi:ParB-like nuclease domain
VQEFDSPQTDTFDIGVTRAVDDDTPEDPGDRAAPLAPQREGLPAHYRMRAERHYVDSITSASAGVPIRLIALSQFDEPAHDAASLEPLIKSIRVHGIVQPLLVRKRHARYEVIAGKRRFAAAATLGLTEVPSVLHQVDDSAAAALSAAENIRVNQSAGSLRAAIGTQIAEAVGRIADDVARLQTSVVALRSAPEGFERATTADLLAAQAARTAWLANTAALLASGKCRQGKRRPLASIVDDLVRQLEPECRLAGLRIDASQSTLSTPIDDSFVSLAIASAIMLTLSLVAQAAEPSIDISTRELAGGGVAVTIVQRQAVVAQDVLDRFATRTRSAWTPMIFSLGAMALEHATAAHGGAADLVALDERGSAIELTFNRL